MPLTFRVCVSLSNTSFFYLEKNKTWSSDLSTWHSWRLKASHLLHKLFLQNIGKLYIIILYLRRGLTISSLCNCKKLWQALMSHPHLQGHEFLYKILNMYTYTIRYSVKGIVRLLKHPSDLFVSNTNFANMDISKDVPLQLWDWQRAEEMKN